MFILGLIRRLYERCGPALVLAALLATPALAIGAELNAPWTQYLGSHYQQAPWADSIRDPGGPGRAGAWPIGVRGNTVEIENERWDDLLETLHSLPSDHTVVLSVGGIGGGRNVDVVNEFLDQMSKNGGKSWRDALYKKAFEIYGDAQAPKGVTWQFGNEINGPRIRRHLQSWAAANASGPESAESNITLYAEYFLAPGVEVIRAAEEAQPSPARKVPILLGSAANARNSVSLSWLEDLLNYRIKGTYAESLKGKFVYEVVDGISIHYLLTSIDRYWFGALEDLFQDWVSSNKVDRIWATEEVGTKRASAGYGGATALYVTARCLNWAIKKSLSPDQWRCFIWGADEGPTGTTSDAALRKLDGFLGDTRLVEVNDQYHVEHSGDLDVFAFETADRQRAVVIAAPIAREGRAKIDSVAVKRAEPSEPESVGLWALSKQGIKSAGLKTEITGDHIMIMPGEDLMELKGGESILLEIVYGSPDKE